MTIVIVKVGTSSLTDERGVIDESAVAKLSGESPGSAPPATR